MKFRKNGRDVELPPDVSQRVEEARQLTEAERQEETQVRDWFQRNKPGPPSELFKSDKESPCFSPFQVDAVGRLCGQLRDHRIAAGLSLTDVSERSRLTRASISRLENGHTANPTMDTLFRYAEAIGYTIDLSPLVLPPDVRDPAPPRGLEHTCGEKQSSRTD